MEAKKTSSAEISLNVERAQVKRQNLNHGGFVHSVRQSSPLGTASAGILAASLFWQLSDEKQAAIGFAGRRL